MSDVPEDLVTIQRRIDAAWVAYARALAADLSQADIVGNRAAITDSQRAAAGRAWRVATDAVREKGRHPWWGAVADRAAAEQALRAAARTPQTPRCPAPTDRLAHQVVDVTMEPRLVGADLIREQLE
jgi:hypothetical protein